MPYHDSTAPFPPGAPSTACTEEDPLGMLCFGDTRQLHVPPQPTCVHVPMTVLAGDRSCEAWLGQGAASGGSRGVLHYRHDAEWLFGVVTLSESDYDAATAPPLQQAADAAYRQIFALQDALGYPCIHRCWNYMADINGVSHGLERYRQFNVGRQQAFLACERQVAGQ